MSRPLDINYANVISTATSPSENHNSINEAAGGCTTDDISGTRYAIGGLIWNILEGHKMEDY